MADLGDEVDVLLVLRLLTLTSLVFPVEVEEAAGQDEVAAGVRRPAAGAEDTFAPSAKDNGDEKSSVVNVLSLCAAFVALNKILTSSRDINHKAQHRHHVVALQNTH